MGLLFVIFIFVFVCAQRRGAGQFNDANVVALTHSGGGWMAFLDQWLVTWFRFQHQKPGTGFANYVNNKVIGSNSGGSWFSTYLTHSPMVRDSFSLDRETFIKKVAHVYKIQAGKLEAHFGELEKTPQWINIFCKLKGLPDMFNSSGIIPSFCTDVGKQSLYAFLSIENWKSYLEQMFVELNKDDKEIPFDSLSPLPELKNVDWMVTNMLFTEGTYKEEDTSKFSRFGKTVKHTGYVMDINQEWKTGKSEYVYYPTFTSFKFDGSKMPERQVEIPLLNNKDSIEFASWEESCDLPHGIKGRVVGDFVANDLAGKCNGINWLYKQPVVEVDEIKKAVIDATEKPHTYSAGSSAALGAMGSYRFVKTMIGTKAVNKMGKALEYINKARAIAAFSAEMNKPDISAMDQTYQLWPRHMAQTFQPMGNLHVIQNLIQSDDLGLDKDSLANNVAHAMWKYAINVPLTKHGDLGVTVADGGIYDNTGLIATILKLQQNSVMEGEIVLINHSKDEKNDVLWIGHGDEDSGIGGNRGIFKGTKDKSRVITYPGDRVTVTYHEQCVQTVENEEAGVKAGSRYKIKNFQITYHPELLIVIPDVVDEFYVPAMKEVLDLLETIPYDEVANTCSWTIKKRNGISQELKELKKELKELKELKSVLSLLKELKATRVRQD